jgi:SAM-dependent methyltransferase
MDLAVFRELRTPAGQEVLAAAQALAPREADYLLYYQRLARRYPPPLARAALEIAIQRARARAKIPQADRLYFTRESLEQASSYPVSTYRAGRYAGFVRLVDLGCGAGGDTLALAGAAPTLGLDLDPLRLAMAGANLAALGLGHRARFVQADLATPLPIAPGPDQGLFFDPARRADGRRTFSVRSYRPPLPVIQGWLLRHPALGVKLSPGVKLAELTGYQAELEFISVRGQLKEAVLWFGPLAKVPRRATLLPGPHHIDGEGSLGEFQKWPRGELPLAEPGKYLYEPDPAVIRAGLVGALGRQLDAAQLDPDIAYLTADQWRETPFARAWPVEDWLPFNLKRLRAYLRARGIGRLVVKKRGSPLQPEELIRRLRLQGERECVIFLTQLQGKPIVVIGEISG